MYILNMKITKHFYITLLPLAVTALISCGSTKNPPAPVEEEVKPVEKPVEAEVINDDYHLAVGNLSVSKDTFESDQAEIMNIIDKLSTIMKDFDYQSWLIYVDSESKEYWSKPANLKKAQSKLPVKGLQIRNLQDYFKYVFVSSRIGRQVTAIRYVSDTYVKAVQVTTPATAEEAERVTVYYYFNKKDGHWELHLPEIEG